MDYSDKDLPKQLPNREYDDPAFGDFITVDVAARLPSLFREEYGDSDILGREALKTIYLRLLRFDDLRPQSALLDFLLTLPATMPGTHTTPEEVWRTLVPVARTLLNDVCDHPFLRNWLRKLEKRWQKDPIDYVQGILDTRMWNYLPIPLPAARFLYNRATPDETSSMSPERFAVREEIVLDGSARFVVAGHTHRPQVELLKADTRDDRYYVNTGTWRTRIYSTQKRSEFGRLKGRTYVIFYGSEERGGALVESFDYWEGTYRIG